MTEGNGISSTLCRHVGGSKVESGRCSPAESDGAELGMLLLDLSGDIFGLLPGRLTWPVLRVLWVFVLALLEALSMPLAPVESGCTHLANEGRNVYTLAFKDALRGQVLSIEEVWQVDCGSRCLGILVGEDLVVGQADAEYVCNEEDGRLAASVTGDVGVEAGKLGDGTGRLGGCNRADLKTARGDHGTAKESELERRFE